MIFRYFRGVQGYVPAASHVLTNKDRNLSTWVGTALSLAKVTLRRKKVNTLVQSLEGKTIVLLKTIDECEFMLRENPEASFLGATSPKKRAAILAEFFARDSGVLVMTDSMFVHLLGYEWSKVNNIVLTVYGAHSGYFCGVVYKCNPDYFYHIVDNAHCKGIIPKFVQNLQQIGNEVTVDKDTLITFKFDRSLDTFFDI